MVNYKELELLHVELHIKEDELEKLYQYIKNDKKYDKSTLSTLVNHYTKLKNQIKELRDKIENIKSMAAKKYELISSQKISYNKRRQYDIKNDPIVLFTMMNEIVQLDKNIDNFLHKNKKINYSDMNYTTLKKTILRNSDIFLKKIDLIYENYKHLNEKDFEEVLKFTFD